MVSLFTKDLDIIESVQRNLTRRLFARYKLPYGCNDKRCKILVLERLELRRIMYGMTLYFKIVSKFCDTSLFNEICFCNYTYDTHGHKFKCNVQYAKTNVFKYFFLNRYVNVRNMLPLNCVNTNLTKCLKQKLHNVDLSKYIIGRLSADLVPSCVSMFFAVCC